MDWHDDGMIIGTRRHGETSLIVELMTANHGRHLGLVRGGRSRRLQPLLQPGNSVHATWRARLEEHLGNYGLEPRRFRAAELIAGPVGLYGLQTLAALLRLLPERDPHPRIFQAIEVIADGLGEPLAAGELVARFELQVLNELGFGLDLSRCAATGATGGLSYVSPRTGRAVTAAAGEPYVDRLLALPAFLVDRQAGAPPAAADLAAAFRLTGYFLDRHLFGPRGIAAPEARTRFIDLVGRAPA